MGFERHGYQFEGAFTSPEQLEARAGVYLVWCKSGETWTCLDVGESHNVQEGVLNHDRADEWRRNCRGVLYYAAHYTPNLRDRCNERRVVAAAGPGGEWCDRVRARGSEVRLGGRGGH
jgi:hypothetical protein